VKYLIESYSDKSDCVKFHFSKRIAYEPTSVGVCAVQGQSDESLPAFVRSIVAVEGVIGLFIHGYEVNMIKSKDISWSTVMEKVLAILAELDPVDGLVEEKLPVEESNDYVIIHLLKRANESTIVGGVCLDPTVPRTALPAFAKKIVAIEGVVELYIYGCGAKVFKDKLFNWSDIKPKVLAILADEGLVYN
jgi:hypothetical protein